MLELIKNNKIVECTPFKLKKSFTIFFKYLISLYSDIIYYFYNKI